MRRVHILVFVMVVALMSTGCLFGGAKDEQVVLDQVKAFYQALFDLDRDALARVLTDEITMIVVSVSDDVEEKFEESMSQEEYIEAQLSDFESDELSEEDKKNIKETLRTHIEKFESEATVTINDKEALVEIALAEIVIENEGGIILKIKTESSFKLEKSGSKWLITTLISKEQMDLIEPINEEG